MFKLVELMCAAKQTVPKEEKQKETSTNIEEDGVGQVLLQIVETRIQVRAA